MNRIQSKRLLRIKAVKSKTSEGTTAIYEKMASGKFPRPVKTGVRGVAWVESEIDDYIDGLIAARDAEVKQGAVNE